MRRDDNNQLFLYKNVIFTFRNLQIEISIKSLCLVRLQNGGVNLSRNVIRICMDRAVWTKLKFHTVFVPQESRIEITNIWFYRQSFQRTVVTRIFEINILLEEQRKKRKK